MSQEYPSTLLERAVNEFTKLPGIGRKTATRLVLHLLRKQEEEVESFSDSIIKLLNKVSDGRFKTDLTDQLNGYESFAAKAKGRLKEMGAEAKEENPVTKLWASIGMTFSTLTDSSDSHIAQMVAEGSNMGITDAIKLLRDYENTGVSESALKLVRDIIEFEENNLERAKKYI